MDKQKLIAIAKDQLKGGIGEDQVRELLIYRGVESSDVESIMQSALSADAQSEIEKPEDVVKKADEVITELLPDVPLRPEYIKKERKIIMLSVIGFIAVVVGTAVLYYLYF